MIWRLLLLLLVSGCSSISLVDQAPVHIGDALVVAGSAHWNRLEPDADADADEAWTAEGVTLDMLLFYAGIADGDALGARADKDKLPVFRAGMLAHDIVDLYEAMVARDGGAFRLERLAPAAFGGAQGFLFEHRTTPRTGAALRGRAYGAVVDGRLYLISYTAPEGHFYAKHLAAVEAIAASARIRRLESAASASP
jgi:hypothetical protein